MSEENSPPPTPVSSSARRASFSQGQKFSDIFGRSPTSMNTGTGIYPGPITTAAANAQAQQRRRTSISALGLSGSPTQSSLAGLRNRTESWSSGGTNSIDENAIEEGDASPNSSPSSTFGRRLSFGARAYQEARLKAGSDNGEGFKWSEQLRSRAERSSSITSPTTGVSPREPPKTVPNAATQASAQQQPAKLERQKPDAFQERILKGDFYMD